MSSNPPVPPGGGDPYRSHAAYGQTQYGQAQLGQAQLGQAQPGQAQLGQTPYGTDPYGQAPGWPSAAQPPLRGDYASWGRRAGGMLIDQIPSLIAQALFFVGYFQWIGSFATTATTGSPDLTTGLGWMSAGCVAALLALGWTVYNRWLMGGRTGQSIGRRVSRISLISEQTGQPIGALNAFARDMCHVLDGMAYVGYLWPLWDKKKQTFADMLMRTVVIDAPQRHE